MAEEAVKESDASRWDNSHVPLRNLQMTRRVRPEDMDRSFDVEFWQRQGLDAIFEAAIELFTLAYTKQGDDPAQLRLAPVLRRVLRN